MRRKHRTDWSGSLACYIKCDLCHGLFAGTRGLTMHRRQCHARGPVVDDLPADYSSGEGTDPDFVPEIWHVYDLPTAPDVNMPAAWNTPTSDEHESKHSGEANGVTESSEGAGGTREAGYTYPLEHDHPLLVLPRQAGRAFDKANPFWPFQCSKLIGFPSLF